MIGAFWQKEPTETIAPSPRSEEHRTPFSKISENNRLNKYNKWIDTAGNNEFSAQARFQNEFFYVNSKPKFLFNKDDGFFGIGSCFARNIEHSLKERNLNCLTDGIKIPAGYYNQDRDPRAAMNKFNIPSMIDEINRTFDGSKDESARYIEISENAFLIPQHQGSTFYRLINMPRSKRKSHAFIAVCPTPMRFSSLWVWLKCGLTIKRAFT